MVLLSAIKQLLHPEQPFEKGHPVQLLLYLFNQFNQESVIILLNQIEIILPPIPNQSKDLTERAEKIFDDAFQTHKYYENATAEQKELIEEQIEQKRRQIKESRIHNDDTKQTELDDDIQTTQNTQKEWMDSEQFRLCDLYFRKASKLAPKCIKCYLKHLKFLMQCNKTSLAQDIFSKASSVIKNNSLRLDTKDLHKIENLLSFYYAYLHYMKDDITSFDAMLTKCLQKEPDNIGMRCQYIVCLTTAQKYEESYIYLIETLKLLSDKKIKENIDTIRHYRVVCGIGCAAIRCLIGVDWDMVIQHLQFVIDNDDSNIGVIRYCLSYCMYKEGRYDESNDLYNEFTSYIDNKKAAAEKGKEKRNKMKVDQRTEEELKEEAMKDAASELTMDFFKWHPNNHKDNKSEIIDLILDAMVISILIFATYSIAGYAPHIGNSIMDWFVIAVMLIISCILVTPSLGILLMAVTLPPYNNAEFNYFAFGTRWLCVSAGLLFVYRVVIGQQIPAQRLF